MRVWKIASSLVEKLRRDHVSVLAAALAFYSLLSIFPGLSALISLYGLFADPNTVRSHLSELRGILPTEALSLLSAWLETLLARPRSSFGSGLLISLVVSLWIARNAAGAAMTALNLAYEVREQRRIVHYNVVALSLTALFVLLGIVAILLAAVLPLIISFLPLPPSLGNALSLLRWPLLAFVVFIAVSIVYHFGPNRPSSRKEWTSVGAALATILWILGSLGISIYVGQFTAYEKTYGSIGAAVILLLWLWLAGYSVLVGAELNSVIERRHKEDFASTRS